MTDYFGERMMQRIIPRPLTDGEEAAIMKSREGKEKHKVTLPDGREYWVY